MGLFKSRLSVWNPTDRTRTEEVEAWVDTGAAFSWILRSRLKELGVGSLRRMQFRTIEGRVIERDLASVFVRADGYEGPDTVVMAESGDSEVIGAHTIEGLGLAADPVQKKLVPTVGLALRVSRDKG